MPQNETEHKLKITADDRGVRQVGRTIRESFSPKAVREFKQSTRELERDLRTLTSQQLKLVKAMGGVEKATDQYKKLKDELKGIQDQSKAVETTLTQLNRAYAGMARTQQQRQGFVAGLAQGTGVAQYMPTGPGMMPRMGGAMVGGMLRRAAAPFTTPGMAGLQQMLPGPLAGALTAAQGMFQEAVGFQRQRLQMIPFAGGLGGLISGQARTQAARAAVMRQGERQAGGIRPREEFIPGAVTAARLGVPEAELQRGFAAQEELVRKRGFVLRQGGQFVPPGGRKATAQEVNLMNQAQIATGRFQITEQERGRVETARGQVRESAKQRAQQIKGPGLDLPTAGEGVGFGLGPQQTMQFLGQFMGARGGVGAPLMRRQEAMAAQALFGVGPQITGAFERGGLAGGGGRGQMGLSRVLATAFITGLKGSRLIEFMQELVGLQQIAEKRGVKIDTGEFVRQTAQLRGAGIAAPQAQRIAGGLNRRAMDIAERGIQGPGDLLALRAFGFDPSGGRRSYIRAITRAEGGFAGDPGALGRLLGMVTSGIGGQTPEEQSFFLKRFMGRQMGTPIGMGIATQILGAYRAGGPTEETNEKMAEILRKGQKAGTRQNIIGAARRGVGVAAPLAVTAAGIQAERIELGGKSAEIFVNLERTGLGMVKLLNTSIGPLIKDLTKIMKDGVDLLNKVAGGDIGATPTDVIQRKKEAMKTGSTRVLFESGHRR
jgi:hypothetical protein